MMKHEENGNTKLIEQARTLLSPYLDDEVTPAERELVETMLVRSPELQIELESLQATVNLVRNLPRTSAPRPFTLTGADVGLAPVERKVFSWSTWLKPLMGGLAVVIAMLIAVVYLLRPGILQPRHQGALNVARAPVQSAGSVAEEAPAAAPAQPAVAPAQEEKAGEGEAEGAKTVEVEKAVEAEKSVEDEKEVQVAKEVEEEPPAEAAAEAAVTSDTSTEAKPASEAPVAPEASEAKAGAPPQPLPTSSPALELLAQPEPTEEPAAAEMAEEGIMAQKAAPEAAQEAVVPPTVAVAPSATATPSPMTTPSPPTATPTEVEAMAERGLEQPADDGTTATSVAAATPSPIVSGQATQLVKPAQTPTAQKPANFTSTARSPEAQSRGGGETSLINFLPAGLTIILVAGGILVVALLWRFFRRH
jgi:hypothetical protein